MKILVIGAGNLLLSDEGFGVHFIRHLQQNFVLPDNLELLDAGTMGMMVMHKLEDAERVYIVDVIAAEGRAGECRRYMKEDFTLERIPIKLSPHQAGIQEMLMVSEMRGRCPRDVFLLGVIPESYQPGCELSPPLKRTLHALAQSFIRELQQLGLTISAKS